MLRKTNFKILSQALWKRGLKKEAVYLSIIFKEAELKDVKVIAQFDGLKVLEHVELGVWTIHRAGNPDKFEIFWSEEDALKGAEKNKNYFGLPFDDKPSDRTYMGRLSRIRSKD